MKSHKSTKQLREFGFLLGFGITIIIGWLITLIFQIIKDFFELIKDIGDILKIREKYFLP